MGKDKYIMSGGIKYQMHEFCLFVNVQTKFRSRLLPHLHIFRFQYSAVLCTCDSILNLVEQ